MQFSREDLLETYRDMRTIREFEERVHNKFATDQIRVSCTSMPERRLPHLVCKRPASPVALSKGFATPVRHPHQSACSKEASQQCHDCGRDRNACEANKPCG